jgi:hypothetical protein
LIVDGGGLIFDGGGLIHLLSMFHIQTTRCEPHHESWLKGLTSLGTMQVTKAEKAQQKREKAKEFNNPKTTKVAKNKGRWA